MITDLMLIGRIGWLFLLRVFSFFLFAAITAFKLRNES